MEGATEGMAEILTLSTRLQWLAVGAPAQIRQPIAITLLAVHIQVMAAAMAVPAIFMAAAVRADTLVMAAQGLMALEAPALVVQAAVELARLAQAEASISWVKALMVQAAQVEASRVKVALAVKMGNLRP